MGQSIVGWVALPIVLYALSLGLGFLIERVAGFRTANALVAPMGFGALMCLTLAVYTLGGHGWVAVGVSVVAAIAGLVWTGRELPARLSAGWLLAAGLGGYLLVLLPTALTGHWSWTGYNFANDTSVHLLLAEHLQSHALAQPATGVGTPGEWIRLYLESRYPIGTHAGLATLGELLRVRVEVLYQAFIAGMIGLTTMAMATLSSQVLRRPWLMAAAALVAVTANLTYQYALQGSIKEIAMLLSLASAAALGRDLLASRTPVRAVVGPAIALAGGISAYSSAAIPYVGLFAICLALAMLVDRRRELRKAILPAAGIGTSVLVVAALATIVGIIKSAQSVEGTFSTKGAEALGQLARPIPLSQTSGVYLQGEYIFPIANSHASEYTAILTGVVLVLAALGLAWMVLRRDVGPLLFIVPATLTYVFIAPHVVPYGDAKILAIASPGVVLAAFCGAFGAPRIPRAVGAVAAVVVAGAVVASAAFAYHAVRIAPTARLDAMRDAAAHLPRAGQTDVLDDDEFAKYFAERPNLVLGSSSITPRFAEPRDGGNPLFYYDADQLKLAYVESFDGLITRRGPAASRPPANFAPTYGNAWYVVWRKIPGLRVLDHLPLQGTDERSLKPTSCKAVLAAAATARSPGRQLVASVRPPVTLLDTLKLAPAQEPLWQPAADAANPGVLRLVQPGKLDGRVVVRGGRYRVWLRGSVARPIGVSIDGRRVGAASGRNSNLQYLHAGTVTLTPGPHSVQLERGAGNLDPGDGAPSYFGPLALERIGPSRIERIDPARAGSLCNRSLDWIEVVQRGGT
jgi:hypothetical protein